MKQQHSPIDGSQADVVLAGVEKRYGNTIALRSMDLSIERGELFALLGPSGCGKSTTLRLIAGFEQPSAGRVFVRGNDVTRIPSSKRNFGIVFQGFALFPHMTVAQNVGFGLRMRKLQKSEMKQRVMSALELVGLDHLADRYPRQLSGGQQQRAALARAIVIEPDVLVLDEPMSALDKILRDRMQVEIRRIQQRLKMTTILVTHDQEEALGMADRVGVLNGGRIEQVGTPRSIYETPRTTFVATFLGASNLLTGKVEGYDGAQAAISVAGRVISIPRGGLERGATVPLSLRPEKIRLCAHSPFMGKVKEMTYKGSTTYVEVDVNGVSFAISGDSAQIRGQHCEVGNLVGLEWDARDVVVLEDVAS
ncbi:ABC transporter ATP-binding protein [Acetobacter sp. TBRC 12305]|uniref:Spermidine/putrescine import ATP-binding protein PotA n=1 Tax=Acetobacter garciniae TaxID=2817435 RepID=A0A939KRH0_9PROT|nr:ABC transporter ATP-binding protein [Acetobacter garciniae]MBO1325091.1 ABC transporter ATP-binding protein [Acetobacter garciniae]MBX0344938.1 ABC transporter ATP-binding protein [Acetobacter garciniae]